MLTYEQFQIIEAHVIEMTTEHKLFFQPFVIPHITHSLN